MAKLLSTMTARIENLPVPPASARNAGPIRDVLCRLLPAHVALGGVVLDIASGVGHHAATMAAALPGIVWQPSEIDSGDLARIAARVEALSLPNLRPPIVLDTRRRPWGVPAAAILCINMIHISPWRSTVDLFAGAAETLPTGGLLVTYGPYKFDGDFGAESNRTFDESLKARNPEWGVRDVRDLDAVARENGFARIGTWPMPANNHILAFQRAPDCSRPSAAPSQQGRG